MGLSIHFIRVHSWFNHLGCGCAALGSFVVSLLLFRLRRLRRAGKYRGHYRY